MNQEVRFEVIRCPSCMLVTHVVTLASHLELGMGQLLIDIYHTALNELQNLKCFSVGCLTHDIAILKLIPTVFAW